MSNTVISVENLGKKYLIAHQAERQRYVALRDVLADKFTAPLRWLKDRRQRTEIRGQRAEVRDQKSEVSSPTSDLSSDLRPPISELSSDL